MKLFRHIVQVAATVLAPGVVAYAASPGFQSFVNHHAVVAAVVPVVTALWAAQVKPYLGSNG